MKKLKRKKVYLLIQVINGSSRIQLFEKKSFYKIEFFNSQIIVIFLKNKFIKKGFKKVYRYTII